MELEFVQISRIFETIMLAPPLCSSAFHLLMDNYYDRVIICSLSFKKSGRKDHHNHLAMSLQAEPPLAGHSSKRPREGGLRKDRRCRTQALRSRPGSEQVHTIPPRTAGRPGSQSGRSRSIGGCCASRVLAARSVGPGVGSIPALASCSLTSFGRLCTAPGGRARSKGST